MEGGTDAIVALQPNGSLIATAKYATPSVALYNVITGDNVNEVTDNYLNTISTIAWSPDGSKLIAGNLVFDVANNTKLGLYETYSIVVGAEWRTDQYEGTILVAEQNGRLVIQDINVLPNYNTPTPLNWELTETTTPEPTLAHPIANAGVDQTVIAYDRDGFATWVNLDGSGSSSPNGKILVYQWVDNNRVISGVQNPTELLGAGTHTITLTIADEMGLTATDTVIVVVIPVTLTPTFADHPTLTATPKP